MACFSPRLGPPIQIGPEVISGPAPTKLLAGELAKLGYVIDSADPSSGIINTKSRFSTFKAAGTNPYQANIRATVQLVASDRELSVLYSPECTDLSTESVSATAKWHACADFADEATGLKSHLENTRGKIGSSLKAAIAKHRIAQARKTAKPVGPQLEMSPLASGARMITRRSLDGVLANLSSLAALVRIVPSFSHGRPNGFKLFNVKAGSIFEQIGLKSGDIIKRINGMSLDSPDKALVIYQALKNANELVVELARGKEHKRLLFEFDK